MIDANTLGVQIYKFLHVGHTQHTLNISMQLMDNINLGDPDQWIFKTRFFLDNNVP